VRAAVPACLAGGNCVAPVDAAVWKRWCPESEIRSHLRWLSGLASPMLEPLVLSGRSGRCRHQNTEIPCAGARPGRDKERITARSPCRFREIRLSVTTTVSMAGSLKVTGSSSRLTARSSA
jgi:hypothetical protein